MNVNRQQIDLINRSLYVTPCNLVDMSTDVSGDPAGYFLMATTPYRLVISYRSVRLALLIAAAKPRCCTVTGGW